MRKFHIILLLMVGFNTSFAEDTKAKAKAKIPTVQEIQGRTASTLINKARVNTRAPNIQNGHRIIDSKGNPVGAISKNQKCVFYGNYFNGRATKNTNKQEFNAKKMVFKC